MDKFIINGGKTLRGEIDVPCAKNAYLPIIAACMLHDGKIVLHKVPDFVDVNKMLQILQMLGAEITKDGSTVTINCENANKHEIPSNLAGEIRSSIFLMGAILGRLRKVKISYPGGCDIGSRPIDLHLNGLRRLSVKIKEEYGMIECDADGFKNETIHLDFPSVGATENLMMASVLSRGQTRIINAAKEPEIADLADFINAMGGKVYGAGTDVITVVGVSRLRDVEYTAISDRIITGTYLIATLACGGDVVLKNANYEHLHALISKMRHSSCKIVHDKDKIHISSNTRPVTFGNFETLPYPGFATDLQAQSVALQTISKGTCVVSENLFETRYKHVPELVKMGAKIMVRDRMAIITGVEKLYGTSITCHDLRGGAALTIAGLVADGQTILNDVKHIDRGYNKLEEAFAELGADITRVCQQ